MAENFYRLTCFLVNICSEQLRRVFLKYAKSETAFTSTDAYIGTKRKEINELNKTKKIRKDHLELLYPQSGMADESQWDISLLVVLTTELFRTKLKVPEQFYINEIRVIRNALLHLPNTAGLTDKDYEGYWNRLEIATLFLANQVDGKDYEDKVAKKIYETKLRNVPYLLESLRIWFEESQKEWNYTLIEMNKKMEEMNKNVEEMKSNLQDVTVAEEGPTGSKIKKLKTVDPRLLRLKENFERLVKKEPSHDISCRPEINEIQKRLREKHHVIVTGFDEKWYLEAALAAFKNMNYKLSRCVEMMLWYEWHYINPNDVDLVLCRDPFGDSNYDKKKAKSMTEVIRYMLSQAKESRKPKRVDVIFVTDRSTLNEFQKQYGSKLIFEEVVEVVDSTTESLPADLTKSYETNDHTLSSCSCQTNQIAMTELFLQMYVESSKLVDKEVLLLAKTKFKQNKMIVITGPRRSGKTSLAVALLASSCPLSHSRVLFEPSDVKTLDLKSPCLVVIDDFAGKYRYEMDDVSKWFKAFDYLYYGTKSGKIKVIITCEKGKLEKCCKEVEAHSLLEHQVCIEESVISFKQELTENFGSSSVPLPEIQSERQTPGTSGTIQRALDCMPFHVWSIVEIQKINIKSDKDKSKCFITGFSQLPSGEVLIVDSFNKRLKKVDARYRISGVCDLPDRPISVCYIRNNEAVVCMYRKLQFF